MARCLIVANQTLGGEELDHSVLDRIERDSKFYIVVPMTPVEYEAATWTRGFPVGEAATPDQVRETMEKFETRRRAQSRLDQMIEKIRAVGGQAEGELGDPDPLEAARDVLRRQSFDEVIVSTLPSGLSRWLKLDLPNRVARITDVPVTTVEAES